MLRSRSVTIVVAGLVGAVFILGLVLHGVVSAVVLLGVATVLATLSAAAWPAVPDRGRRLRVVVIGLVVVIALVKLLSGR